jgi:hypothetical protein
MYIKKGFEGLLERRYGVLFIGVRGIYRIWEELK